jgi:hypothetical protein
LKFNITFKKVIRKLVGWAILIVSALFFLATSMLIVQGDFGPVMTGFWLSFALFVLGWAIQYDLESARKRIQALFKRYFPRCPICKSDKGYEVSGFFPSTQYVKCKNCSSEWYSPDFTRFKNLKSLRLSKPPQEPEVYAEFIQQSPLEFRKFYPTESWQAMMNNAEITLSTPKVSLLNKLRASNFSDFISSSRRCFVISLATSICLAVIGYYGLSMSLDRTYEFGVATFLAMLVSLIEIRKP